jgi:hypothetical protein
MNKREKKKKKERKKERKKKERRKKERKKERKKWRKKEAKNPFKPAAGPRYADKSAYAFSRSWVCVLEPKYTHFRRKQQMERREMAR